MRTSRFLAILVVATVVAASMAAETVVPLAPFRSIELHHGGTVVVRYGPAQRVTLLAGDLDSTRVRVTDDQRLVIDSCKPDCPRKYRLRVEIITPELAAVSVSNGGTVQVVDAFPARTAIEADVEQGGTIDIRSIPADAVDASVDSGGGIFTTARQTLTATITSGGHITYWGDDVRLRKSIRDGGAVKRGAPADAAKPLSELGLSVPAIPPPLHPHRKRVD